MRCDLVLIGSAVPKHNNHSGSSSNNSSTRNWYESEVVAAEMSSPTSTLIPLEATCRSQHSFPTTLTTGATTTTTTAGAPPPPPPPLVAASNFTSTSLSPSSTTAAATVAVAQHSSASGAASAPRPAAQHRLQRWRRSWALPRAVGEHSGGGSGGDGLMGEPTLLCVCIEGRCRS